MVHLIAFLLLFTSGLMETYTEKKTDIKRTYNFSLKKDNHTSVCKTKQQHGALLGIHHKKNARGTKYWLFSLIITGALFLRRMSVCILHTGLSEQQQLR